MYSVRTEETHQGKALEKMGEEAGPFSRGFEVLWGSRRMGVGGAIFIDCQVRFALFGTWRRGRQGTLGLLIWRRQYCFSALENVFSIDVSCVVLRKDRLFRSPN